MPETEVVETENKKLAAKLAALEARIVKLEAAGKYLMEGAKRVEKEISTEWREDTYQPGEHFGVRID